MAGRRNASASIVLPEVFAGGGLGAGTYFALPRQSANEFKGYSRRGR